MSNIFLVRPNGPLIARGKIRVLGIDGSVLIESDEVFLCRCGHSNNKPFCDGAHKQSGFSDTAEFSDDKAEGLQEDEGIEISLRENAMLIAKGPMTIQSEEGSCSTTRNKAALCRCGESAKKPFCDVSHRRCGFISND